MKSIRFILLIIILIFLVWSHLSAQPCNPIGDPQDRRNDYGNQVGFLYASTLNQYSPANGETHYVGIALYIITDNAGNQGVDPQELEDGITCC
jgi:hypothetical protein